jgi:hypothetical protein
MAERRAAARKATAQPLDQGPRKTSANDIIF